MELFGILIAGVLGFPGAFFYCLIVEKVIRRIKFLSGVLWWISAAIAGLFVTEIILVLIFGPVEVRELAGRWFFCIHSACSLSIAPALGALLLLMKKKGKLITWYLAAPVCWIAGIAGIVYQYYVAESLYGVDGMGGPYVWPW